MKKSFIAKALIAGLLASTASAQVINNPSTGQVASLTTSRIKLISPLTLYVATTGIDNIFCGTAPSSSCATAQQAYLNLENNYDLNNQSVTILEAPGTYNVQEVFFGATVGNGTVTIGGASGAQAIHNTSNLYCLEATNGANVTFNYVTVSGCIFGITANTSSTLVNLGPGIIFGALQTGVSSAHIHPARDGYIETLNTYTISGNADYHIIADRGGIFSAMFTNTGAAVGTLTQNVTFTNFMYANTTGIIRYVGYGSTPGYTLGGFTVTGTQWSCDSAGVIQTGKAESVNFIPGTAGGPILGSCSYNQTLHGVPTISGFGTGASIVGNDYSGYVNEGNTANTGGTITFSTPFAGAPNCVLQWDTVSPPTNTSFNTTAVNGVIAHSSFNHGVVSYWCAGY